MRQFNNTFHIVKAGIAQLVQRLGYGLDGLGSIPGRGKKFFSISQNPGPFWSPSTFLSNRYRTSSQGEKRPGRKADFSPSPSAEVKHGGAIPPLPYTGSWRGA
jgi:hypothetical protein